MSYVYVPNSESVVHPVMVDFGEGSCSCCSCSCSCCCDRGKTKSTPCPTWTELLSLDWSLTIFPNLGLRGVCHQISILPLVQNNSHYPRGGGGVKKIIQLRPKLNTKLGLNTTTTTTTRNF